jgi:NitT/TauT family transport system substrate-binding protein
MLATRYGILVGLAVLLAAACLPATPRAARETTPQRGSAGGDLAPSTAAPDARATEGSGRPPAIVRVGLVGAVPNAGIYVAQERDYFADRGLAVDVAEFESATPMVPLLATGQLDVGGSGTTAGLVNVVAREIPIRIVADRGSTPPGFGFQGVVVRKDLVDSGNFRGCASFKDWRVANPAEGNSLQVSLARLLEECGLGLSDVEQVWMGFGDMPAGFRNGAIDAAIVTEPNLTRGVADGLFALYKRTDEIYPNQQIAVLMYSPAFIGDRREVGQQFMLAYLQGVRDYWDAFTRGVNKAEVVDILTRWTTLKDPALYERMAPAGLNPDGYVNIRSLSDDVEWWSAQGYIRARVVPASVVDNSFVDYAIERLGHYRVP